MKHRTRSLPFLLVVIVLALTPVLPAAAQGGDPRCGGLSDADCQLLLQAGETMSAVTAATIPEWSLSFSFDDGTESVDFEASGQAAFSIAPDGSDIVAHLVVDTATMETGTTSETFSAEIIIDQGMAYVFYEDAWYGTELSEDDLASFGEMASLGEMGGMGMAPELDLTDVVVTTRGADEEMMGQTLAVFTTEIDLAQLFVALLSSPMLGELLGAEGADLGMGEMSPEDMQMIGAFLTPMLGDTTIILDQGIGLEDGYLHAFAMSMNIDLDLSLLAPEVGAITGDFELEATLSNFNEPVTVTPPDSYEPIESLEELGPDLGELGLSF